MSIALEVEDRSNCFYVLDSTYKVQLKFIKFETKLDKITSTDESQSETGVTEFEYEW